MTTIFSLAEVKKRIIKFMRMTGLNDLEYIAHQLLETNGDVMKAYENCLSFLLLERVSRYKSVLDTPAFALLKLPILALEKVLKQMSPFELLKFSKCSNKTAQLARFGGTRNYTLEIYFCDNEIFVIKGNERYTFRAVRSSFEYSMITLNYDNIEKLEEQMEFGFLENSLSNLLGQLLEIFECKTISLVKCMNGDIKKFQLCANVINNLKAKVKEVFLIDEKSNGSNGTKMLKVLDSLNITDELIYSQKISRKLKFTFEHWPQILDIYESSWFDLTTLLATTSVKICLSDSILTNQDLDKFLKRWKAGEYPNLEYLEVKSKKIRNDYPIFDLIPPIKDENNTVEVSKKIYNSIILIKEGVEIESANGATGVLKVKSSVLQFFAFH